MSSTTAVEAGKIQPRLKQKYNGEIKKALQDEFGYENVMQIPGLVKVVVNTGVGEAARDRLTEDGVFVMYNFYREDWIPQKMAAMLADAFGSDPIIRAHGSSAATLAAGPLVSALNGSPPPGDQVDPVDLATAPQAATDDWPFLYLREPFIAPYYVGAIAIISPTAVASIAPSTTRWSQPCSASPMATARTAKIATSASVRNPRLRPPRLRRAASS